MSWDGFVLLCFSIVSPARPGSARMLYLLLGAAILAATASSFGAPGPWMERCAIGSRQQWSLT